MSCLAISTIEVHGHRGMRGLWPENTLPGFAAAIEAGVDVLELDLVSTLDRVFVVHHDFAINPKQSVYLDGRPILTNPLISELTLSQVKEFDIGHKQDPEFPRQIAVSKTQIPTLEEVFELVRASQNKTIRLNIEIKRDPSFPELTLDAKEIAWRLVDQVRISGLSDRIDYYSFDPEVLSEIRELERDAKIGFLFPYLFSSLPFGKLNENLLHFATRLEAQILSLDSDFIKDRDHVESLQKLGFLVLAWTVNDSSRWAELIDMGIDGIITDYPIELVNFLSIPSN